MRVFFILAGFVLTCSIAKAQNVQIHYDFGKDLYNNEFTNRPKLTSTVEMFKPDKWGSTFFFIDMDYKSTGIEAGYWEIARELRFWEGPLSIHVEYNGGNTNHLSFNNAYLGGVTYTYNDISFSKGFSFSVLYKYIQKHPSPHSFQLTGAWHWNFGRNGICTFSGFADFWREKQEGIGNFVFLAEPQIWVNLNKIKGVDEKFNLSIGSEVELRNNFAYINGFFAIPTLAIKWSFD